jgi:FkbM family methyltransferase
LIFARLCESTGFVYAFEADAGNAAVARANVARNHFEHVTVCARACGAETGFTTLHLASFAGGHSTVATGDPASDVGAVTVEVTSLDDFSAIAGVRPPDLVKIDVEGAEELVLDGMSGLLSNVRPVLLIELDDGDAARHDDRAAALVERLEAACYRVERLPNAYPGLAWTVSHWLARPED